MSTRPIVGLGEDAVGYEPRDTNVSALLVLGVVLCLLVVFALAGSLLALTFFTERWEHGGRVAASLPAMTPPRPRLEVDPNADLSVLRRAEDARLHSYAWIDRNAGVVRIPIERAMALVAAEAAQADRDQNVTADRSSTGGRAR